MISCEYNYCIYNKKNECVLENINISSLGICEDCLVPDIGDEILDKCKREMLEQLEARGILIAK